MRIDSFLLGKKTLDRLPDLALLKAIYIASRSQFTPFEDLRPVVDNDGRENECR